MTDSKTHPTAPTAMRENRETEPEKLSCPSGSDGRDRALRGPRPRSAGGTNGTPVPGLTARVPRLNGAGTAQRAIPTQVGFRAKPPLYLLLLELHRRRSYAAKPSTAFKTNQSTDAVRSWGAHAPSRVPVGASPTVSAPTGPTVGRNQQAHDWGEAPQAAREARALPRRICEISG